ncbi:MAG TPA: DUF2267 domain-containing protein [Acidimicrobiia bacterium]|nr:DUF2267 domain-containing protein [Acidimicrobiia bacterium]
MKHDDFVRKVAGRTNFTRRRADDATVATLTVLAEALSPEETRDLLAQLPKRYKEAVPIGSAPLAMRPVEMIARVADLIGDTTLDEAETIVRAVFATLDEAVNAGEMRDVIGELGNEFAELFGRAPLPEPAAGARADESHTVVPFLPRPVDAVVTAVVRTTAKAVGGVLHRVRLRRAA